ncbi:MAG: Aspartate-semialdehyde dehydrogenase [Chlamydiae bacterium]|nr:Aspartate-semialdehyde dehydrogenase [Chlamydiota bacterium]
MQKIPVAILGATGVVGQKLIELLISHPWFEIKKLAASERSVGKSFIEAIENPINFDLPQNLANMKVSSCDFEDKIPLAFSALDSKVATEIESNFLGKGTHVISNAKNFRMQSDVPLLIPGVNSEHLPLIESQKSLGKIINNPNCAVAGLALALKPIHKMFGLKKVIVTTMQALSGAGNKGPSAYAALNNILPHIHGEEEKVEQEPKKILGQLLNNQILPLNCKISAQCNRVPVLNGHFMSVSVELEKPATQSSILFAFDAFNKKASKLPSSPQNALTYFENLNMPQPKIHQNIDKGMSVSIGKLRRCSCLDFKFNLLLNNLVLGAAGGALLNAEALLNRYPELFMSPEVAINY